MTRQSQLLAIASFLLSASPAPSLAETPGKLSPRERGDLAIQARAIFKKHCIECHSGGPGSRGNIVMLDHANLVAIGQPVPFVLPKKPDSSEVIQLIEDGSMPPGNRPKLSVGEIATLKRWIAEAAPRYPREFDEQYTLAAMLDDVNRQEEAAPYLRYVSLAHLVRDDLPIASLKTVENSFQQAFKRLRPDSPAPEPVDDAATLFRFDVRKMGWDGRELFLQMRKGAPDDLYPLTPYDLVLLEYPFGFRLPPDHPLAKRLSQYLRTARLIEPIAFLRADWLADKLVRGSPLADDVSSLQELAGALEAQGAPALNREKNMPCGPATRAFGGRNPVAAAARPETSLPILPLGSRYSGNCQAEPPPFAVKLEAINIKGQVVSSIKKDELFRLRATADRDLHFVLLMVWSDGTVRLQQTNKAGFLKKDEAVLLVPKERGAFQIADLLTGEPQGTEYFVLLASQTELPAPVLVKSRHSSGQDCQSQLRFPVSRFFFDPEAKAEGFDPSRIVRLVVPITVTE
jgi:mono/diheme cytochrome c family protein